MENLVSLLYKQATDAYKEEKFNASLEALNILLKESPDHYEAHFLKSKCLKKSGKEEKAIEELNRCIEINQSKPHAFLELSSIYKKKRDYKKEGECIDKALKYNPGNIQCLKIQAFSKFSRKDYEDCIKLFEDLMKKFPNDIELKIGYINSLNRCFQFEKADKAIDDLIKQNNSNPKLHQAKSNLYKFRMKFVPAIEEIDKALNLEQVNKTPYFIEKLILKYYHGDFDEVIEQGEELVKEKILLDEQYFVYANFLFYYASAIRNKKATDEEKDKNYRQFKYYFDKFLKKQTTLSEEVYFEYAKINFENKKINEAEEYIDKGYKLYGEKSDFTPLLNLFYQVYKIKDVSKSKMFKEKFEKYLNLYENRDSLDNTYDNNYCNRNNNMIDKIESSNSQTIAIDEETQVCSGGNEKVDATTNQNPILDLPSLDRYGYYLDSSTISQTEEKQETKQTSIEEAKEETKKPEEYRKLLGTGGFAEVYKERDLYTKEIIAAKYLNIKSLDSKAKEAYITSLNKEVTVMLGLEHKNIVPIISFHKRLLMIQLELEEGGDLKSTYENYDLPDDFKLYLIRQIANGLQYLHEHKIIHGDLKCNNVLLNKPYSTGLTESQYPTPKLSDFGLSDVQGSEAIGFSSRFTCPEYLISIEKKRNGEQVSLKREESSDIFSFGMLMFEIISQGKPFKELTTKEADQSIKEGKLPDIEMLQCERPMKELIKSCLSFDKSKRPTIIEIVEELNEIQEL